MKVEMLMPQMGESITEATISKWLKKVGEQVKKDEIILEISTDKVDSEIPTPAAGVIVELKYNEGDVVPIKTLIAVIDTTGTSTNTNIPETIIKPAEQKPSEIKLSSSESKASDDNKFISPLVKSLAEKHGISHSEIGKIHGTGQAGRVTKEDFLNYINNKNSQNQEVPTVDKREIPTTITTKKEVSEPIVFTGSDVKIVPMDNMRKLIAEHMVKSKQTSPHVYSIQEVDMSKVSQWRNKYKNECKEKEGFNLSFTPFFLEATVRALVKFPYVNASVEGTSIVLKKNINLGCAVALPNNGLIVPVIKSAEEKNLIGLARGLNSLADKARKKQLSPNDIMNGTFTVTNPGVFGTIIGTPIINQPQVAILCLGAIEKRPVVIEDMIAIRERCYLTLSYDHRIIDGSLGGQFLAFIREYLENWDMERTLY